MQFLASHQKTPRSLEPKNETGASLKAKARRSDNPAPFREHSLVPNCSPGWPDLHRELGRAGTGGTHLTDQ